MEILSYIFLLLLVAAAAKSYFVGSARSASDVLRDLTDEPELAAVRPPADRKERTVILLTVAAFVLLRILSGGGGLSGLFVCMLIGFAAGVLISSRLKAREKRDKSYRINFFLPLVMERVVMGVQAGLDILPAIGVILEIEKSKGELDPVTELLAKVKQLSDAGLSLEESLNKVAGTVENSALRHAFIHLSLAYKEGGELVFPLRELSDSTQVYYQEVVEEEIAKMPVKATMPLLLTFAGLIVCFITSPIIQILDILKNAMP